MRACVPVCACVFMCKCARVRKFACVCAYVCAYVRARVCARARVFGVFVFMFCTLYCKLLIIISINVPPSVRNLIVLIKHIHSVILSYYIYMQLYAATLLTVQTVELMLVYYLGSHCNNLSTQNYSCYQSEPDILKFSTRWQLHSITGFDVQCTL